MSEALIASLVNAGLSDKEARIYYAALAGGPASVLQLARSAELPRTTAYSVIESLRGRGLLKESGQGRAQFAAENPERAEAALRQKADALKGCLPELRSLFSFSSGESLIRYYDGLDSVREVYEGLLPELKPAQEYRMLLDLKSWYAMDSSYVEDFSLRLGKLNLRMRMLSVDSAMARLRMRQERIYHHRTRLLPRPSEITSAVFISEQKVLIHGLAAPFRACVLQNRRIAEAQAELFDLLWIMAPGA